MMVLVDLVEVGPIDGQLEDRLSPRAYRRLLNAGVIGEQWNDQATVTITATAQGVDAVAKMLNRPVRPARKELIR